VGSFFIVTSPLHALGRLIDGYGVRSRLAVQLLAKGDRPGCYTLGSRRVGRIVITEGLFSLSEGGLVNSVG